MSLTRVTSCALLSLSLHLGACGTTDVAKFEAASERVQSLSTTEMGSLVGHLQEVNAVTPENCKEETNLTNEVDQAKTLSAKYTKAVSGVSAYSNALTSLAKSADEASAHSDKIADSLSTLAGAANVALPGAGTAAQEVFKKAIMLLAEAEVRNSLKKTLEAGQPVVNCVAKAAEDLFGPNVGGSATTQADFNPYDEFIDGVQDQEVSIRECQAGRGLIQAYETILMDRSINFDLEIEIACLAAPHARDCAQRQPRRSAQEISVVLQLIDDQRQRYREFEEASTAARRWGTERKKNWIALGQAWRKWAAEHAALARELTKTWPWSTASDIDLQCGPSKVSG